MMYDKEGHYDVDYQILLTKNSKAFKEKKSGSPTEIKNTFRECFKKHGTESEEFENSTTTITLVNKDDKPYSIDFAILRVNPDYNEIIRRNIKRETSSVIEFTWNKLDNSHHELYTYFKKCSPEQRKYIIEQIVIPEKFENNKLPDNHPKKRASVEIFRSAIARYKNEH
ncbi:hypothetical protein K7I13_08085 [Brucepastera parasyntrophica]|uniref:hypothetical protein n=1 Tax=Brucepastera parasyntrophica TaxID=2880008 RepID=UPI00210EA5A1|nr:hypothetical protein [Brucepastera parasyntrophica]ULQ58532.1 hypothetical protein K7I13_08085 [Brucepastera parasyntrophica]